MKLKSFVLGAALLLTTAHADQSAAGTCVPNMTGFSVAGLLGGVAGHANIKDYSTDAANSKIVGSPGYYQSGSFTYNKGYSAGGSIKPSIGLNLDYKYLFGGHTVLGAEIFGDLQNNKINALRDNSGAYSALWNIKLKKQYTYGFALKFGHVFARSVLGYVSVGGAFSKITLLKRNSPNAVLDSTGPNTSTIIDKTSFLARKGKTSFGCRIGLGADIYVTNNLFWKLQYAVTLPGNKLKLAQNTTDISNALVPTKTLLTTVRYSEQQFNLGIGYKF